MIISDDIYLAAYLSIAGLKIVDVKIIPNSGGKKIEFALAGEDENSIADEFKSGDAKVNIKNYLYKLFELRDVMYSLKNTRKTSGGQYARFNEKRAWK